MNTLDEFREFIRTTRMTHIYKPVMLQAVLKRGGVATKEEIAADIVNRDVLQHEHYRRNIVDQMPGKRLVRDGALVKNGDVYSLAAPFTSLRPSERLELIAECERQIENFISKYGDRFKGRNDDPIPGSLRFEVLKRAGGRCELCGTSHEEVPLDVDHIIPRAKGGNNDWSNLQVLCRTCNAQKRDRDDTDFRSLNASYALRDTSCVFCQKENGDEPLVFVAKDAFPVTPGHHLIIPRRHVSDYFELTGAEHNAIQRLLRATRDRLAREDKTITGFNIGANIGASAGQTIFHVHVHLIPRRDGDMSNPRGGVRGVIPEMQKY
jgi:diadenosine tetraphosphate (Ap4A) HIT family hydrolase/5-methylcytosine-specific restriction endonuclease McrA